MSCPLCKGDMIEGITNVTINIGKENIIVISQVPAQICEQCGEVFIEIQIVQEVEVLVEKAKQDGITYGFLKYQQAA